MQPLTLRSRVPKCGFRAVSAWLVRSRRTTGRISQVRRLVVRGVESWTPALNIPSQRSQNQYLTRPHRGGVAQLVSALGAVQAQEYAFAKWGLALRLAGTRTDADLEAAFDRGEILRTHVMRPTWHFVAAEDIVWMLELTGPRVLSFVATYAQKFGIEQRTLTRAAAMLERAMGDGRCLTRAEVRAKLSRARIVAEGTPLWVITLYAELERIVCSGPRRGKQFTYALLSERAHRARPLLDRDEALARLTQRYFASHGPATVRDFVWWSGMTTADAKRGLQMIGARRVAEDALTYWMAGSGTVTAKPAPQVHLLPIYDEYLVAYRDRIAVPHTRADSAGTFRPTLVIDGQVAGTWTTDRAGELRVAAARRLSAGEWRGIEHEVDRFSRFIGKALVACRV